MSTLTIRLPDELDRQPRISQALLRGLNLTIRLPDELDRQLSALAEAESKTRSEVARAALEKFFRDREREQFMLEMIAEMKSMSEEARREALEIAEEAIPFNNEALDIAEGRNPGDPWPQELGEKWWK